MKKIITLFLLILSANAQAQLAGNFTYNRNYYPQSRTTKPNRNYIAGDSTLVVNTKVLLNQKADRYLMTLSVMQTEMTTKAAVTKINQRINGFIEKTLNAGKIKKEDIHVDFICQSKIYEFDEQESRTIKTFEQVFKGFEIKKNIIIRLTDPIEVENIIIDASEFQIYDLVKMDYINDNISEIYNKLLDEATMLTNNKKEIYLDKFGAKTIGNPSAHDSFDYYFPNGLYKEYSAMDSQEIGSNSSSYIKKLARQEKTLYYEGVDYSGYDKVINNATPEIGIQYVLELTTTYILKKENKK